MSNQGKWNISEYSSHNGYTIHLVLSSFCRAETHHSNTNKSSDTINGMLIAQFTEYTTCDKSKRINKLFEVFITILYLQFFSMTMTNINLYCGT